MRRVSCIEGSINNSTENYISDIIKNELSVNEYIDSWANKFYNASKANEPVNGYLGLYNLKIDDICNMEVCAYNATDEESEYGEPQLKVIFIDNLIYLKLAILFSHQQSDIFILDCILDGPSYIKSVPHILLFS